MRKVNYFVWAVLLTSNPMSTNDPENFTIIRVKRKRCEIAADTIVLEENPAKRRKLAELEDVLSNMTIAKQLHQQFLKDTGLKENVTPKQGLWRLLATFLLYQMNEKRSC